MTIPLIFTMSSLAQSPAVRVTIVGLSHGHVAGLLQQIAGQHEVQLVGIVEEHNDLIERYRKEFDLPQNLFYSTIEAAVDHGHPQALLVYTSIAEHRRVISEAGKHGLTVMVEKPLTLSLADALAIKQLATERGIAVLVNYETTWYASNRATDALIQEKRLGELRKIVVHDGHPGPKEIGVPPEFLKWLTDPAQAGAGALYDFGCYGAALATRWMNGRLPLSVTAIAQTDQPATYPHVDDDATIILQYPTTQVVIMPSWNWPFSRKDSEIYGTKGYAITVGSDRLRLRFVGDEQEKEIATPAIKFPMDNSLHYLAGVVSGTIKPDRDLSSLDTNVAVMQILDAARTSVDQGRSIKLNGGSR
jgi:predicted dehydrogenase